MISLSDRKKAIELIQEANRIGARLANACKELNISVRTYQRWIKEGNVKEDQRPLAERPEPKNKLTLEERQEIINIVNTDEYADLPPSQIVPKLADEGRYMASESTFYRFLHEEKMQNHRGRSKKPVRKVPTTHIATGPNQVWTWDITWLKGPVLGLYFYLYMIIDIFSRKIVGWEIWETESAEHAQELIRKAVLNEKINGRPLVLHSDNGSPMKAATFQATLEKLGIQKSYSRPRVSNDNPYSEAMFRTLKYRPEYPENGFENVGLARIWGMKLIDWYNNEHYHSGINFVTPNQRHTGKDTAILKNRKEVYEKAKLEHPERWAKTSRSWDPVKIVALNPIKEEEFINTSTK